MFDADYYNPYGLLLTAGNEVRKRIFSILDGITAFFC